MIEKAVKKARKPGSGGARSNSGRKIAPGKRAKIDVTLTLDPDLVEWIDMERKRNGAALSRSAWVENRLRGDMEFVDAAITMAEEAEGD